MCSLFFHTQPLFRTVDKPISSSFPVSLYLSPWLRCIPPSRQRYVARPLLWHGRKFHFRVYALLRADMTAWLYRTAYILSASRPYSLRKENDGGSSSGGESEAAPAATGFADELVHISNLAVNKHTAGHPGQVSLPLVLASVLLHFEVLE